MDINTTGTSEFGNKGFNLNFPIDAHEDYPIALHVSEPHALVFLVTAMGYLHLYELEHGEQLVSQRVSRTEGTRMLLHWTTVQ